jgi:hypothetical protein
MMERSVIPWPLYQAGGSIAVESAIHRSSRQYVCNGGSAVDSIQFGEENAVEEWE